MSVEDLSSGNQLENGTGRVFVVDPNPINNQIIPPEDMFIYVKLSATPRNRVTYNGEGFVNRGVEDEVNFISTKIRYNDNGELDPKEQNTYATTDWSNIGGLKGDTKSAGVLEGFGIKSINIKYNASFVPVVDITFTDVRGGALFDVLGDKDILSPYSLFFKMPYPVFNLEVKGYFGQKVEFCLHMVNWNSQFDGSTGNFDITANFLGFQQAFLNDMVIGNIIGVINTSEGYAKLNEIFERTNPTIGLNASDGGKSLEELQASGELNIRKLDDFFIRISKLQIEAESLKTELQTFKTLKFLNGKLALLEQIKGIMGGSMGKEPDNQKKSDGTSKNFLELENSNTQIQTSPIGTNRSTLRLNDNYLSIRDFIIINKINLNAFKNFIITLNDSIKQYNEYVNSNDNKKYKDPNSLSKLSNTNDNKIAKNIGSVTKYLQKINKVGSNLQDQNFIDLFSTVVDEEDWKNYIIQAQKSNGDLIFDDRFKLSNVLESMYTSNSSLQIYLKDNYDGGNQSNLNFKTENFINEINNNRFYNILKPDTIVAVADFREKREILEKEIVELKNVIKQQQEVVQFEFNEQLFNNSDKQENVFKPTIKNCFEILANNAQAMVETVYQITEAAQDKSLSGSRKDILGGYSTDIPPNISVNLNGNTEGIAWPSIYERNESEGTEEEIYIGQVTNDRNSFPEYDFVERVFENFIAKRKELKEVSQSSLNSNGVDTDNWYPFNPADYNENPFINLRFLLSDKSIKEYFVEQMLTRIALLKNYSLFNASTGGVFSDYAKFDAINAFESIKVNNNSVLILGKIISDIQKENIPFTPNSIIGKTSFFKNNIEKTSGIPNSYNLKESDNFPTISDIKFGLDYNNPNNEYILFGKDYPNIINNSKSLWKSISQSNEYTKITDNTNSNGINRLESAGEKFYKTYYNSSNNLFSNLIYNVWDKNVANNIFESNKKEFKKNIKGTKMPDIDITANTSDTIGKYINKTYFNPNSSEKNFENTFTNNTFYGNQTIYGRGYLLLSTIPFRNFKEAFLDVLFPNGFVGSRVVNLPKYYIYYLGSLLWRYKASTDPIDWSGSYSIFQTNKNSYPTKITYYKSISSDAKKIEDELLSLPDSVKDLLINKFKRWVDLNFSSNQKGIFEVAMENYVSNNVSESNNARNRLLNEFISTEELIILNPNVFNSKRKDKEVLRISNNDIKQYIDKFSELFTEKMNENSNTESNQLNDTQKAKQEKNILKLKLGIYNYFKNINDKWIVDSDGKGNAFNICGGGKSNLIEYFKFIDRGWRPIGDKAVINLNSFLTLGSNQDISLYTFMSKLLRDSNFLFQILPTYINYKNGEEVAKIFKPQTVLEENDSSGPTYCCIYVGGTSQVLDIKETNNYYFDNDGFAFKNGELPPDIVDSNKETDATDDFSLVAFRVAFGAQNQTIFTNLSLNQQEHKETGEYFKALSDLVDKRGATQKTYQGTDLLRLYKTRSYKCSVDALGCMNIQPLMYFDLQNVPFFNGAYLITSVSHNISPNHMTTNFSGLRQSRFTTQPVTNISADVGVDFNEKLTEFKKIEFINNSNTDPIYSYGVNPEFADQEFDFGNITITNLNIIGVPKEVTDKITDIDESIINPLKSADINTNAEVSMFFASALSNSDNFLKSSLDFSNGNYADAQLTFPSDNPDSPNTSIEYSDETTVSAYVDFTNLDSKYTEFQPTTSGETTNTYNDIGAYYFSGVDSRLDETKKVKIDGGYGPPLTAFTATADTENLKYFNIFKGDAYLYRPTGFLYMIGRKQYTDLYGNNGQNKPFLYNNPSPSVDDSQFNIAFEIAIKVWKNIKDKNNKTASDYAKSKQNNTKGSFTIYDRTVTVSQDFKKSNPEVYAKSFEKVLSTFKYNNQILLDVFNP